MRKHLCTLICPISPIIGSIFIIAQETPLIPSLHCLAQALMCTLSPSDSGRYKKSTVLGIEWDEPVMLTFESTQHPRLLKIPMEIGWCRRLRI